MTQINSRNQGMALILTLITVSAIITITVSMIGLSLQQLQLSVDSRDSERAFHAASAGLECAQFTRNEQADAFVSYDSSDGNITLDCMGETRNSAGTPNSSYSGGGDIYDFSYQIEPTLSGRDTCIQIDISVMQSPDSSDMTHNFGGQTGVVTCEQSSVCTVAASRGYNQPCGGSTPGSYEILRELNAIF